MAYNYPSSWARINLRINGGPFGFTEHQYLREIYQDHHPRTVIEKASQMGLSTFALTKAIWACETRGMKVIYFFPTDTDVRDFSRDRFSSIINESHGLKWLLKKESSQDRSPDNIGLKRLREGTLYFRGLFHPGGARWGQSGSRIKSVDADFIIFDELDESQQVQKEAALHRLDHSSHRWILELSTPTVPGYGIDQQFQKSDQRFWMLRCPACGGYNCPEDEFPGCLVRKSDKNVILICVRCKKPLDVSSGQWVPKSPGNGDFRGYHISQLYSSRVSLYDLLNEYEDPRTDKSLFYNHRLGMPYINAEGGLSREDLLACCRGPDEEADLSGRNVMGVDQGRLLHYVILSSGPSGKSRLLNAGTVDEFGHLDTLMEQYDVRRCVIDALPNQHSARDFSRRHPRRVYCCYYNSHQKEEALWIKESDGAGRVEANRTQSLDATFRMIRNQEIILPPKDSRVMEIAGHCANLIRTSVMDQSTGQPVFRYIRTGDDHLAHALNYCRIAGKMLDDEPVLRARLGPARPGYNRKSR